MNAIALRQVIAHLDKTIRDLMLERDALASLVPEPERVQRVTRIKTIEELLGKENKPRRQK